MAHGHKIFGVTGWKNAGKTTLLTALVTELVSRNYIISTVKHAHHSFDIDREGTDSWKHRQAGSRETALVSARRWAIMHELEDEAEPPFEEILTRLSPCDLVLVEGYKREAHEKIEIIRGNDRSDLPRWPGDRSIAALAIDARPQGCTLPCFNPDDITAIADFIVERLNLPLTTRSSDAAQ